MKEKKQEMRKREKERGDKRSKRRWGEVEGNRRAEERGGRVRGGREVRGSVCNIRVALVENQCAKT